MLLLLVQLVNLFSASFELLLELVLIGFRHLLFRELGDRCLLGHIASVPVVLGSVLSLFALVGLPLRLLSMLLMPFLLLFLDFLQILLLLGQWLLWIH